MKKTKTVSKKPTKPAAVKAVDWKDAFSRLEKSHIQKCRDYGELAAAMASNVRDLQSKVDARDHSIAARKKTCDILAFLIAVGFLLGLVIGLAF